MGVLQVVEKLRPDAVERIERDLSAMDERRRELVGDIERHAARVLDLEDDGELMAAMAAGQAAKNRLRKLDARIDAARDRLNLAEEAARAKRRAELLAIYTLRARAFAAAGRAAQEALGPVIAAREMLASEGFAQDYQAVPAPPSVNGTAFPAADLIAKFEAALDPPARLSPAAVRAPAVRPQAARSDSVPGVRRVVAGSFAPLPEAPRDRRPRPLLRETAADGESLVVIIRSGIEHPRDGRGLRAGDVVAMPADRIEALLRNQAVELFTPEMPGPQSDASAGVPGPAVALEVVR